MGRLLYYYLPLAERGQKMTVYEYIIMFAVITFCVTMILIPFVAIIMYEEGRKDD